MTTTYTIGGLTGVVGGARMDSRGYVASDYQQGMPNNTPGVEIVTELTNNCPASGTCSGLGSLTMTFNQPVRNPVLNIAGLGGYVYFDENGDDTIDAQSQYHAVLNLGTPGLSLTKLSGGNLAVSGNSITNINPNSGTSCVSGVQGGNPDPLDAQASAGCGSVRINGIVNSVTFNVTGVFVPVSATLPGYTENDLSEPLHNRDNYVISMTVPQDFGDAPASYDQNNAARAILSDVTLGPNVTEDNALVANGTSSPNVSASATLDQNDDGVTLAPFAAGTSSYSTTVAINGASKAGTVCGWIDFDKDTRFDNPAERACATFAAGATQATLNWTGLSGVTAGDTYARFRVGYNSTQTQVPIGASDSGEVEDYTFTISPAIVPAPSISLVKSVDKTTMVAGETATYSFTAQNTGNVTLTGVVINETQFSGTGNMSALSYTWPRSPWHIAPGPNRDRHCHVRHQCHGCHQRPADEHRHGDRQPAPRQSGDGQR
ncbi:GEVED domain-containing protein [Paenarthrobacter ureafaciens]